MPVTQRQFPPFVTYLIVTMMSVALLAMQTTLPFMIKTLGGDFGSVGFLFMWSSFWYVMTGLLLGWISHHVGPRRVMLATLAMCAVLVTAMIWVNAMWQLYVVQTLYYVSICLFWAAAEHASTGLHAHLSLVQSTSIFCVAFSVGNAIGTMLSSTLQGQMLALPFLVSVALTLCVFALTWITVSPHEGFQRSSPQEVAAFPEAERARLRRSLLAARTGMIGTYGTYALVMLFLPRYLWEQRGFTKPLAGALTSLTLVAMALTFAAHGLRAGWTHRLWPVRLCPFAAAAALLLVGISCNILVIGLGAIGVGVAAGTAYTHNLYYSLEEPGWRAQRAGIHEALVGVAYMIPPALGGCIARRTDTPSNIFWTGAVLALLAGVAQQLTRADRRDVLQ
jgi:predicted MFS family arabinose efflux permease